MEIMKKEVKGAKTKKFEGFRPKIYRDSVGKRTIGYGFNIDDKYIASMLSKDIISGKRAISTKESDQLFRVLYSMAEKDAADFLGEDVFKKLDDNKKEVVVDMAYNMGLPKLSEFKKFKAAIEKDDYKTAGDELINSKWYWQVGNRSKHHVNIFRNIKENDNVRKR